MSYRIILYNDRMALNLRCHHFISQDRETATIYTVMCSQMFSTFCYEVFKYTGRINELSHDHPFTYYLESTSVINILLYLFYPVF